MIHYHGTPMGGKRANVEDFLRGRHALIPFVRQEDLACAAMVCESFCFDNGAFSAWKSGNPITDWRPYYGWCQDWARHPGFDFAIVPDVIDGSEKDNDELLREWDRKMWHPIYVEGAPVWHLHESLERLQRLCTSRWRRVCIGSSGQWATPGTDAWRERMSDAMRFCCDEHGRPLVKLHGLRMLSRKIFPDYPFASADSTNVAQNANIIPRFGMYPAATSSQRGSHIAAGIECLNSSPCWVPSNQKELFELESR